ncbi:uncharacterized protein LOC127716130 isoform X5 [Mytilus californianus]|uniref:uncharacterized protein LOC127716130 isoform X5 n=1 Tax=Mytilus californianus TaxID=6549 RepID=UPI002245E35B|nr:uncharacterized protein LOC127716130 isoform X5 [Mytilus californianus]
MKTIIIFIFIFAAWIIGTLSTFNLKCPQYVQRYIRSQQVCPNHPLYYSCLCNTENTTCSTGNEEIIHEYCNDKPEFAGIGQKYVWSGGLRNIECSSERFQPPGFNLWQNVSSQCIYLKSFCNEEGQVIHINGSAEKDVSCRCDHTKGYDFVTNITDKSSCKPLEKDCSCYVKKCLSNENLSKDYSCIASNNKNTVSQDQQIPSSTRQPIVEPQDLMFNITGLQRYNHEYRTHLKFGLTVLICLFLIIGCYLMIVCLLGDLLAKFTDTSTDCKKMVLKPKGTKQTSTCVIPKLDDNAGKYKAISDEVCFGKEVISKRSSMQAESDPKTASSDPRERDNSTQNIPFLQNSDHSTDTGVIGKHTVLIHDTEPSDNLSNCNANAIPTHNEKRTESTSTKDALEKSFSENTAQNIDSTKNVDESQESTTDEKPETTTEDIDSTEDFAESYQLTTDIQPESKELNNDFYTSLKKTNVRAVIALDVGTTHSRYAVLITETLSCKEKWEPVIEDSVPTAVLFKDSSKNYIACGDEAMPEYICAIENGERESYLMFEKFKLELYKRMEITAEMKIKDGYGRPMLAIDVYTAVINDLKQRALIHTERKKIEEIHIAWVMTVPDVWNKNAKDFIQLTCESSGIPKEQLIIEDESIAILKYFQDVQYFCKEKIISQNLDDKNYLLIDLGGGTCDITGYHVTADCDVGVPIKPTHIACGVDIACNAILERISSMIGDRAMDCMKEEETSSFLQLKEACLQLCKTSEYTLKLNVPIHIFDKLCTRFRLMSFEETVDDFGKTLSCGNSKHIDIDFKLSGDKLIVRKGLIDDSLKVVIGTVISEIMHILKTQKAQDIQQFFIVGGFSSLLIVQNEIQEAFKEKSVLFANDKVYSSVKGAFLCRCNKIRME